MTTQYTHESGNKRRVETIPQQTEYVKPADDGGTLFLTLSLSLENDRIVALCGPDRWSIQKLREISNTNQYEDSRKLKEAISPMFDDISDRKRQRFVDDFLFDTPSLKSNQLPPDYSEEVNLADIVTLHFPQFISWETEGIQSEAKLSDSTTGFQFQGVRCRMFWFGHPNGSMTYHLSFAIRYQYSLADYYALSCLQKLLSPKEKISKLFWQIQVQSEIHDPGEHLIFWEWIKNRFDADAFHFFTGVNAFDTDKATAMKVAEERKKASHYQQLLSVFEDFDPQELNYLNSFFGAYSHTASGRVNLQYCQEGNFWGRLLDHTVVQSPGEENAPVKFLPEHRTIFLFQDRLFFKLLNEDTRTTFQCNAIEPWANHPFLYDCRKLPSAKDFLQMTGVPQTHDHQVSSNQVNNNQTHDKESSSERMRDAITYYFLSGFFQNIIDFFRQDTSEVHDGTDSEYSDPYFHVYAAPKFLYEIVETSRSLTCGEKWIGTCPYLFLTHIMIFHNEVLINKFERKAAEKFDEMADQGLQDHQLDFLKQHQRENIINLCHKFRLYSSQTIHKYLYDNVMRYDTEKAFFTRLQDVRQTGRRLKYWDDMFGRLEHSVQNIHEDALREQAKSRIKQNDLFNLVIFILSLSGCFQIILAVWDKNPALKSVMGILTCVAIMVCLCLAAVILYLPIKR